MQKVQFDHELLVAISELLNSYYLLNYSSETLQLQIKNGLASSENLNPYQVEALALSCVDSAYSIKMLLGSRHFTFVDTSEISKMLETLDKARGVRRHTHHHITNRVKSDVGLMFGLNVMLPKDPASELRDCISVVFRGAISKSKCNLISGFNFSAAWHEHMQMVFFESNKQFINISQIHVTLFSGIGQLTAKLLSHAKENEAEWFYERLDQMLKDYQKGTSLQIRYWLSKTGTVVNV
ncbi:MAG: hypothetical protein JSR87_08430 [Proteobacteria bacterium]|nr:hypothetical protein [Pseudomonadota bacterium]MBS0572750.1 hypothetical protein [Pseudomonadota bacterium]